MNCKDCQNELRARWDDGNARAPVSGVAAHHLAGCKACQAVQNSLMALQESWQGRLEQCRTLQVSPSFQAQVMVKVAGLEQEQRVAHEKTRRLLGWFQQHRSQLNAVLNGSLRDLEQVLAQFSLSREVLLNSLHCLVEQVAPSPDDELDLDMLSAVAGGQHSDWNSLSNTESVARKLLACLENADSAE